MTDRGSSNIQGNLGFSRIQPRARAGEFAITDDSEALPSVQANINLIMRGEEPEGRSPRIGDIGDQDWLANQQQQARRVNDKFMRRATFPYARQERPEDLAARPPILHHDTMLPDSEYSVVWPQMYSVAGAIAIRDEGFSKGRETPELNQRRGEGTEGVSAMGPDTDLLSPHIHATQSFHDYQGNSDANIDFSHWRAEEPLFEGSSASSAPPSQRRRRAMIACVSCRKRKIKCVTSEEPPRNPCARCVKRGLLCEYVAVEEDQSDPASSPPIPSHPPPPPFPDAGTKFGSEPSPLYGAPLAGPYYAPSQGLPSLPPIFLRSRDIHSGGALAPTGRDEGEGERAQGDGHDGEYDYKVGRESEANATSLSSPRDSLDAGVPYSLSSPTGSLNVVLHSSPMDGLATGEHPDPASTPASVLEGTFTDQEEDAMAFPNETQIATFVMYIPETLSMSSDPTAIRPEDIRILEEHVPEGGNKVSGHRSTDAENWVERHYHTPLLDSIRSVGLGGPMATMLSPDIPALAIFGSILDDRVLDLAKTLSDVSDFAVMVRPTEDDPLAKFIQYAEAREMDLEMDTGTGYSTEGDDGTEEENQESVNSDADDSDTDSGEDYGTGGAFRPRGGALRADGKTNRIDSDYIVPAGVDRPDGFHRARVNLHLQLHENCLYNVAISSKTAFKFQTEKAEAPHALEEPMSRPQLLSCVDLKVEARPFQVLADRSYSNLGFIVHCPNYIAGREYLPRGFDPPSATATYGTQKSTENARSLVFGLDSLQPILTAKLSHSRTAGETVQLADNKPAPPCHVQEQIGEEWNKYGKSYSSYDVAWHPLPQKNGHPRPVNIRFGMGIEFYGKEERYITRLPTISHVLRNQIILWVFDPELKAKVRGMIVLTSTYIPDIKIAEPLTIAEDEVVDLSINGANDPPTTHNAPLPHDAANSVAIGIFEQRPEATQSGMRKLMHRIIPKSSSRKRKQPMLIDLPLHEYVARGWDATNEQWRNTVWPTLDERFSDAGPSSSAACWNLALHPGPTEDGMNCDPAPEASDIPSPAVPQIVQTMLVDPPTEKDFGRPGATTLPVGGYSDTESGSSASESNAGDVVDALMHGVEEKTRV